jgi:hypothetical protein
MREPQEATMVGTRSTGCRAVRRAVAVALPPALLAGIVPAAPVSTTANTAFDVTLTPGPIGAAAGGLLLPAIDPVSFDAFYINSRETATPPQLVVTVQ